MYCCILRLPHPLRQLYYTTKAYTTQAFSALFAEKSTQKKPGLPEFRRQAVPPFPRKIVNRNSSIENPLVPLANSKKHVILPPVETATRPRPPPGGGLIAPTCHGEAPQRRKLHRSGGGETSTHFHT